jgi:hypothetical protein
MTAHLPGVQKCRGIVNALAARAMWRVAERRHADAWSDLVTCHRLARLVARGGTLIEAVVGMAIDQIAQGGDVALAASPGLDEKTLVGSLRDLQALPPMPSLADKVELCERFLILETLMFVDRYGIEFFDRLASGTKSGWQPPPIGLSLEDVDWDPALRIVNSWFNRLVSVLKVSEPSARAKALDQFDRDQKQLVERRLGPGLVADLAGGGEAQGRVIGELALIHLTPAISRVQTAADRTEQALRNVQAAFALAAYRRVQGRYPERLESLTPDYLQKVPNDLFVDGPLRYHPSGDGYVLYSVGPNRKDDQGRDSSSEPRGDDLSVHMPLPPLREK